MRTDATTQGRGDAAIVGAGGSEEYGEDMRGRVAGWGAGAKNNAKRLQG
jgi:hypothetical protein